MAVVSKLEDENRRLRDQLSRTSNSHKKSDLASPTAETVSITREELECIKNLTEENIKFKRILKSKDKELTQKTLDVEAVSLKKKFPEFSYS
jgi:Mg2+ and Co2+ transporter CorA